jgi:hypothetical protein
MTMPFVPARLGSLLSALALAGLLAACAGDTPTPPSGAAAPGNSPAPAESASAGAEAGGGETPLTRFVSSRNHYRVDAPGTMAEGSDGVAKSSHGLESLQIVVVSGSAAADPAAYARSELNSVRSTSGFALRSGPETVFLRAASSSQRTVYASSGANNPVTGKPQTFVTVRYYVPRNSSTMAVLIYSNVVDQFDPQGADDLANTFVWQ